MKKYAAAIHPNENISARGNLLLFSGARRQSQSSGNSVYEAAQGKLVAELVLVEQDSKYLG